jgi:hypothetical protein
MMPEIPPTTLSLLRAELRAHLLRAAAVLADARCDDAEALALTRNTTAAVLTTVETVMASPLLDVARAA